MNTYILAGNQDSKVEFTKKYIDDKKIPSYDIFVFEEELKIAQAREIKKILSTNSQSGNRLIVIKSDPTLDAQNALLKTLEELDDDTSLIFEGEGELLPTIVSRCLVVRLGLKGQPSGMIEKSLGLALEIVNCKSPSTALIMVDKFFSEKSDDRFVDLIFSLREILIQQLMIKDYVKTLKIKKIINKLIDQYQLVSQNNLNPKVVVEIVILDNLLL